MHIHKQLSALAGIGHGMAVRDAMTSCATLACLATLVACSAVAETVLFDFETETERAAVPTGVRWGYSVSVENRYAASGDYAVHFACPPWRKGIGEWPSCEFRPAITNWTGFDRLVVELVSLRDAPDVGEGPGKLMLCLAGPTGNVKQGLEAHHQTPRRGYSQWVVPLKWPKARDGAASLAENVARIHFFTVAKNHRDGHDFYIDRIALLKKGDPLPVPQGPCVIRDILPLLTAAQDEQTAISAALRAEMEHRGDYERFCRDALLSEFRSPDMAIGMASSMEKIMPRGRFSASGIPPKGLEVRLARNEYESIQIMVAPVGRDLKHVKVSAEGAFSSNIDCDVVGFVNVTNNVPYNVGCNVPGGELPGYARKTRKAERGWWPDPILDFLDGVDISGADVQSFWIRVHCPESHKAGEYKGSLVVSAEGVGPVRIPLTIRVNDFTIGRASPLPMAITFHPPQIKSRGPQSPCFMWKRRRQEWGDFLADYFITMDDLYNGEGRVEPLPFDIWERLKEQGRLGLFNLGNWMYPKSTNEDDVAQWRADTIPRLRRAYDEVKAHGLLDHAYCYGCDEVKKDKFPLVRIAVRELKEALPGVPISTTAFDHEFGVGTELDCVDWFTPETHYYDMDKAIASRKAGHQVWWYICCGPHAPFANMFVECQAIEGRILMGAQTVRMRPDGFLYYQISLWRGQKCIETGPFTEWDPCSWTTYNGDGSWTCVGPDGKPIPTIRLENFRDGLEDYAYAKILENMLREVESGKRKVKDPAKWSSRARKLIAVPDFVIDERPYPAADWNPEYWRGCPLMYSMTNYTDDPAVLYRWRDAMADLIESARP